MRLPFITRKKHEQVLAQELADKWEQCRETLIIRGRLWEKDLNNYRRRIKELENALGGER